jgi:hypothetical protein
MADLKLDNVPGTGPLIRADQGSGTRATADFMNFQADNTETFSVDYQGLPDPGGNQATRQIVIAVGDIAADSDAIQNFLFEAHGGITITAAYLVVDTATATGAGGNAVTIVLKNSNADATIATYLTGSDNPALAQATVTTMGSITNATIAAGGYVYCTYTKTSSGLALSGLTFIINYTMSS